MDKSASHDDAILHALPLPLKNAGIPTCANIDDLIKSAEGVIDAERIWGVAMRSDDTISEFSIVRTGSISIATGRTKPVATKIKSEERVTVKMCYAGEFQYREGTTILACNPGEILSVPNQGGLLLGGHHAALSFSLDKERLKKTGLTIFGNQAGHDRERPSVLSDKKVKVASLGVV